MDNTHVTLSAQVPAGLAQQVDELATTIRRDRSWIIEEALRAYVAQEMRFLKAVEEGIAAYEAGDVMDHAAVIAGLERRRQAR